MNEGYRSPFVVKRWTLSKQAERFVFVLLLMPFCTREGCFST